VKQNRRILLQRHVDRLFALRPQELLDVGCGDGAILLRARQLQIPAVGVEGSAARVAALRAQRLRLARAPAQQRPFRAAAFAWVTMRHVLHHLDDPEQALREAWRVARLGIAIAEPRNDSEVPSQRAMTRLDHWLRQQQRTAGAVHNANLPAARILSTLPEAVRAEVETYLPLRRLRLPDFRREVEDARAGRRLDAETAAELRRLEGLTRAGEVTLPGTVIVICRKGSDSDPVGSTLP